MWGIYNKAKLMGQIKMGLAMASIGGGRRHLTLIPAYSCEVV